MVRTIYQTFSSEKVNSIDMKDAFQNRKHNIKYDIDTSSADNIYRYFSFIIIIIINIIFFYFRKRDMIK